MLLRDLLPVLNAIAPLRYAEPWDNVGLIAGDPDGAVSRVLITIDCTPAVMDEAIAFGAQAIVSYHPPLFEAIKAITAPHLLFTAIRNGIALYSPHTAFDVASGGTNDFLMDVLQVSERAALKVAPPKETQCKLITFVPAAALEGVRQALFGAGAGRIGNYSECSYESPGTGTFKGETGANPRVTSGNVAIGLPFERENLPEIRLETVVPLSKQEAVVAALRKAHPYEEPAFDLVKLVPPKEGIGIGRVGTLAKPEERAVLIERIKKGLGVGAVLAAGPLNGAISKVAVCAGAGRGLLQDAIAKKVELYLTGELPHHDALKAAAAGMTVVCVLHSNSERAALVRIKDRLMADAPGLIAKISAADSDPFVVR